MLPRRLQGIKRRELIGLVYSSGLAYVKTEVKDIKIHTQSALKGLMTNYQRKSGIEPNGLTWLKLLYLKQCKCTKDRKNSFSWTKYKRWEDLKSYAWGKNPTWVMYKGD